MRLLLVHGAGHSSIVWRTFSGLVKAETMAVNYDVSKPFESILDGVLDAVDRFAPDAVVGHSFGGVVAWHACQVSDSVSSGVSVSSPWGGSLYCDVFSLVSVGGSAGFFRNVSSSAPHLAVARAYPSRVPWLNIVTTKSGVFSFPKNDGVLTVASQDSIRSEGSRRVELPHGHTDVLMSDELPELVASFVGEFSQL